MAYQNDIQKKVVRTTIQQNERDKGKATLEAEKAAGRSDGTRSRSGSEGHPSKKRRSGSNTSVPSASDLTDFAFVTWEDCANVKFQETTDKDRADIRITFRGSGFYSQIGTDIKDDDMGLAGLPNKYPPKRENCGNILHEFGHVLGLEHEHQRPSSANLLVLDEKVVKDYYANQVKGQKRKEEQRDWATSNILKRVEDEETINYTNLDPESIMIYDIFEDWQLQAKKLPIQRNYELSDVDQATITLMYPPDIREKSNEARFRKAMETVHLDPKTAGEIIDEFTRDSEGSPADRLTKLRDRFDRWKNGNKLLYKAELDILRGIDPASLRRSGINQFVGEVTKNKLFQSIMKNIVYRTMVQQGIPTNISIPGGAQTEIMRLIASLSMHDGVGQLVRQYSVAFSGDKDDDGNKRTNSKTTTTVA
ncbi:hypothetical protein HD554DRAFT_1620366 [Boletus coccyginus]|nr:hypothetical protein HD554DRAFT_1620366 [Boletus coccyginus]